LFGKKSNKICEPSRGGIGRRLKKNKNTLRKTPYQQRFKIKCLSPETKRANIKNKMKNKNERIKFENGPAKDTIASSLKGFLNLDMFTGTGLAQPISAIPVVSETRGIK
jgi:hypothetical protein